MISSKCNGVVDWNFRRRQMIARCKRKQRSSLVAVTSLTFRHAMSITNTGRVVMTHDTARHRRRSNGVVSLARSIMTIVAGNRFAATIALMIGVIKVQIATD
jgi:hypothetical protein